MKTKTLLIAAAALAAGVMSSQAQVYSQNIVGYVNIATAAGTLTPISNPLNLDDVNNVTNVLSGAPKGTTVQIWNGSGFTILTKNLFSGAWSANAATNFIPPGTGFFIKTPSAYTNTFVGSVVPSSPGTNSLPLAGGVLQFVGSPLAVSGSLTNAADQGPGTLNLGSLLPKGSTIQLWNGAGYTIVTKNLFSGLWNTNPVISVGQGFFVKPSSGTNWVQTLQ